MEEVVLTPQSLREIQEASEDLPLEILVVPLVVMAGGPEKFRRPHPPPRLVRQQPGLHSSIPKLLRGRVIKPGLHSSKRILLQRQLVLVDRHSTMRKRILLQRRQPGPHSSSMLKLLRGR